MNRGLGRDGGAVLIGVIGIVVTRLAVQGTYRRYVRPAMGPWVGLAGIALLVLGVVQLVGAARSARSDRHTDDGHGAEDPHDHHGAGGVAWLLLAPVLVLVLVAPGPLGAFALGRSPTVTVAQGAATFPVLDPAAGAHEMSVWEFAQRALEDGGGGTTFAGATVRLTGFVAGRQGGDGFVVARYQIACCAADAVGASVRLTGWDGPVPRRDSWVTVEGTFVPGTAAPPRLTVTELTPIPPPDDPYEVS